MILVQVYVDDIIFG